MNNRKDAAKGFMEVMEADLENARIIVRDYPGNNSLTIDDWYYAASTYAQAYEELEEKLAKYEKALKIIEALPPIDLFSALAIARRALADTKEVK